MTNLYEGSYQIDPRSQAVRSRRLKAKLERDIQKSLPTQDPVGEEVLRFIVNNYDQITSYMLSLPKHV